MPRLIPDQARAHKEAKKLLSTKLSSLSQEFAPEYPPEIWNALLHQEEAMPKDLHDKSQYMYEGHKPVRLSRNNTVQDYLGLLAHELGDPFITRRTRSHAYRRPHLKSQYERYTGFLDTQFNGYNIGGDEPLKLLLAMIDILPRFKETALHYKGLPTAVQQGMIALAGLRNYYEEDIRQHKEILAKNRFLDEYYQSAANLMVEAALDHIEVSQTKSKSRRVQTLSPDSPELPSYLSPETKEDFRIYLEASKSPYDKGSYENKERRKNLEEFIAADLKAHDEKTLEKPETAHKLKTGLAHQRQSHELSIRMDELRMDMLSALLQKMVPLANALGIEVNGVKRLQRG